MRKYIPTYTEHLARYVFALSSCYKKSVLDLGAKDGDCTFLLTYGANDVTLADISEQWLNAAKVNHSYKCPTRFELVDLEKSFPEGKWDVITAFEIIEHLEDGDFLIKNVVEHLNKDGIFIFSVPHMVANREHKVLYDEQKIQDLIGRYLHIEEFYVQDSKVISDKPSYKGLKCYIGIARKMV